jgi:glutamate carboxypeptidase
MKELLDRLEHDLPETLQLLESMVNMDSPSLDKALVDPLVRFLGSQFEAIGGRAEYIPAERFGDHLVVRFEGSTGATRDRILLLGHTDTVFPAGEAKGRPFKVTNNRATGPGVFDMKAGIAVMWSALRALGKFERSVTVLLNSDEEMGSVSSRDLIQKEAAAASAVLVLEPSLPGGVLKTARKGTGRYTVKAIGRAAHAGVDPERGINSIEEIAHQVLQLQRLSDPARGTTVTVSVIQGGTRVNVVPAEAAVDVDIRVSTMEEAERIAGILRGLKPHLPGARLEVRGGINRPPMERTTDTVRLFSLARTIGSELGLDIQEGSTGGASDGNFTSALGIPTLDGLGPIGDNAHSPDEFIDIHSLPGRAALLAGLIVRL